jgi:exoribonuclease R
MSGPCLFCGHPDQRHRIVDAIKERTDAGEPMDEVLHDYGWSIGKWKQVIQEVAEAEGVDWKTKI